MARPAKVNKQMVALAQQMVKEPKTAHELRASLCVLLPHTKGITDAETAKMLGVGMRTVGSMRKNIRDKTEGKATTKGSWGGRRRQTLCVQEEQKFLQTWIDKAEKGGVLVVPPIHAALEKKLGRSIAASTVYRMLARHGWRKIEPDTSHPKGNMQAQEEFKKNFQRYWQKPQNKTS